nr:hypothetical protein [Thermoleophilaceae bacterium]
VSSALIAVAVLAEESPAGRWSARVAIASDAAVRDLRLTGLPTGETLAVWTSAAAANGGRTLRAAVAPAGRPFGAAETLAGPAPRLSDVALASDLSAATIAWRAGSVRNGRLKAISYSPSTGLGLTQPVGAGAVSAPRLAMGRGRTALAWTKRGELRAAVRIGEDPFEQLRFAPRPRSLRSVEIAVNESEVLLAFGRDDGVALVATTPEQSASGEAIELSSDGGRFPQVAMSASGAAAIVWVTAAAGPPAVDVALRSAGSEPVDPVSLGADAATRPVVALGAEDSVHLAWIERRAGAETTSSARIRPDAPDEPEVSELARGERVGLAGLDVDPQDIASVLLQDAEGLMVRTRYEPADPAGSAPWTVARQLASGPVGEPALTALGGGEAVAAWVEPGARDRVIARFLR